MDHLLPYIVKVNGVSHWVAARDPLQAVWLVADYVDSYEPDDEIEAGPLTEKDLEDQQYEGSEEPSSMLARFEMQTQPAVFACSEW